MRRRRDWGWFEPAPKQPVPEDGLRVDRFGTTWWGAQWIRALERLGSSYASRLPRGRSYARAGRVIDLAMGAGEVTAGVVGTRARPYRVTIRLQPFAQDQWEEIIHVLAGQARFTIALLKGELPATAGETLENRGLGLFPTGRDMKTSCSCPDWANPCKHVAAVHYVVAAALDMDPFLIFVLRGLGREDVLAALARERGMSRSGLLQPEAPSAGQSEWETPGELSAEAFLGEGRGRPRLAFRVAPAGLDLAGLARLGPPPPAMSDLPRRLGRAIRKASRAAMALAGAGTSPPTSGATKDDDAAIRDGILAFIRQHPEGVTMMLMRSRLPYPKATLRRLVYAMLKDGVLKTRRRGGHPRYVIARPAARAGAQGTPEPVRRRGRRHPPESSSPSGGRRKLSNRDLEQAVLKAMDPPGAPLSLREIARRLDHPVDARLRTAIRSLRDAGTITMTGARRTARYVRRRLRSR